jgi:superfamily II DNA or RNA helicase
VTIVLRDYQSIALDRLDEGYASGLLRLGIGLPTGVGKTIIMTELARRYAAAGRHVWILLHRDQLVIQTEKRMREHAAQGTTVGVVQGDRDVVNADVVVVSVHTLRSEKRLSRMRKPDLIIVDEAHVSMSETYLKIFNRYPDARLAGFTATWMRADKKQLGDVWQKIVFHRSIRWAIRESHLVPPRGISIGAPEHLLDDVRTRGGDYVEADLGQAVSVEAIRTNVIRGYGEHARGRLAVLFAPTRAASEYFREGLQSVGIPSAGIYAGTPARERRMIFDAYHKRRISVLTTCTALAEGWDAPWCDVAMMVRPTKSKGLYVQQVGRVLRPWPGKTEALVLDFVGAAQGMSLNLDAILRQSEPDDPEEELTEEEQEEREHLPSGQELMFRVGKGTKAVDLFAGTPVVWQTTDLGVPFVASEKFLYFLFGAEEGWSVGRCPVGGLKGGSWLRQNMTPEEALNYASIVAVDEDEHLVRKDARWRKAPISNAQIRRARSIGCPIMPADRQGDLADRITWRSACVALRDVGMRSAS